jgi:hypothetical protein
MDEKRKPPNAGKGRPKGVPNKSTAAAKEAFQLAFQGIGGVKRLAEWAEENPGEFFKLYARLIPVEQQHSSGEGGPMRVLIEFPEPTTKGDE